MATRIPSWKLSIALLSCAACSGGGGSDGPASVSGTILFLNSASTVGESEPNDGFDAPNAVGALVPGELRAITGATSAADPLDAYSLLARERVLVTATLRGSASVELELAAWDPVTQTFGAVGRASGTLDTCVFEARGTFDLVVRSRAGGGTYTLEVRAEKVAVSPAANARGLDARSSFEAPASTTIEYADYLQPVLEARAGELLVLPRAGESLATELAARGLRVASRIPGSTLLVEFDLPARLDSAAAARETVARMRSLGEEHAVEYSELNLMRRIAGVPTVPDDEFYQYQWHYPLIHLPEAWSVTTGDDAVIVAVIDTGETAHPDLVARQIPGYDLIQNPAIAADGGGIDADPTDVGDGDGLQPSSFHGTHVAGTIGATTNNVSGVAGVTWAGKIMHLRVLGKGGGTDFDIANGILFAAGLPNSSPTTASPRANVINLSLGGPGSNTTVLNAVTAARAAGCTIFAAAGNNNSGTAFFPAAYAGVISVSAVDINSIKAPYSNFHPTVDFCAPGGDVSKDLNGDTFADGVLSTHRDDSTAPGAFDYVFYNGTSMACPHAAGVAALMLAIDPGHDLTPTQIETLLTQSAVDLGGAGHDNVYGHGLIHAHEAVLLAQGAGPAGPLLSVAPASLNFGASQTILTVQLTNIGSGVVDVGAITVTTTDGAPWLSVVEGPPTSSADVGTLTVGVDRTALADAVYQGNVHIESDGGERDVPVTMIVNVSSVPVDVELFVLAVETASGEFTTLAEDAINPTTDLTYQLTGLPSGSYLIVCGSDLDDDGTICEEDDYCGLYPVVNDPLILDLGEGDDASSVDFPVTLMTAPTSVGGPAFARFARSAR